MRHIFIIIPSPHPTGPIKGAVALANALAESRPTTLVVLKSGPGMDILLDPNVQHISLAKYKSIKTKFKKYRHLLKKAGGRNKVASISFCLSADLVNLFCRRDAVTCSSIRGNLPQNYRFEYGLKGVAIAAGHLFLMRWFDHVIAMTESMAAQVFRYAYMRPQVVGNFVDENGLKRFRQIRQIPEGPYRYLFVGSLTARKQVSSLLKAAVQLKKMGDAFSIDIIGDGNLHSKLLKMATELGVDDVVKFHGYKSQPFKNMAEADCLVLPSLSEGVSRAVLESLFIGTPCLLRDADGHNEIIKNGQNGFLFSNDNELAQCMSRIANWSRQKIQAGENLLPRTYRKKEAAYQYLAIVDSGK